MHPTCILDVEDPLYDCLDTSQGAGRQPRTALHLKMHLRTINTSTGTYVPIFMYGYLCMYTMYEAKSTFYEIFIRKLL